ncbi:MAG: DUF4150 domain-containing protein [Polyangiaceae bacterium]|nr:DUF4150 domain-containing protein [Polyangiaceae bacterium]
MFPVSTKGGGVCFAFPDVCLVPATPNPIPTPFPNTGQCTDAQGTVSAVLIENQEVIVETSSLSQSSGDEAGTGGGVISGTFRGVVKFKTSSSKVYAKGKRVVLFAAVTAHNGDNANMPAGTQVAPSQGRALVSG